MKKLGIIIVLLMFFGSQNAYNQNSEPKSKDQKKLEKQNQKELKRINQLEQQVVADYQKRVAQILTNAETQIKATQIQVQASHDQSTKAKPTLASQDQRANKAQRASKARGQQQRRKSSQSAPQTSNSRTQWFGRW